VAAVPKVPPDKLKKKILVQNFAGGGCCAGERNLIPTTVNLGYLDWSR
jgi:hypothetical protein